MAFEIFNDVPYLVLYVMDRGFCQGKPPKQYLAQFLKWNDGQWMEVPQAEFPVDRALLNLHSEYWGRTAKDDARGLIKWEWKRTLGDPGDAIKTYFEGYHRLCESYQKS